MNVKLVALTQSLVEGVSMNAEELLVYEARVSNPSNQMNTETSDKLIAYLIKNKHWSPLDMINMTIEITTSRAIAHQILRHWSIKPQEFSQRYAEATSFEPIQLRFAADKNRQSSSKEICIIDFDSKTITYANDNFASENKELEEYSKEILEYILLGDHLYKKGLKLGVAKECARMILPLTTSTTMYLNGSVRSWIHYLEQRCDVHAQLEHRQSAMIIKDIFTEQFPNIAKAIYENNN